MGGLGGWLVETLSSAVIGIVVGGVAVLGLALGARARKGSPAAAH